MSNALAKRGEPSENFEIYFPDRRTKKLGHLPIRIGFYEVNQASLAQNFVPALPICQAKK
jgi:hypothetical protein